MLWPRVCAKCFWHVGVCHCLPENDRLLKHCLRRIDRSTFSGKQCFSARQRRSQRIASSGTRSIQSREEIRPPASRAAQVRLRTPAYHFGNRSRADCSYLACCKCVFSSRKNVYGSTKRSRSPFGAAWALSMVDLCQVGDFKIVRIVKNCGLGSPTNPAI